MKTFLRKDVGTSECRNCEYSESTHTWRCAVCLEELPVENGLPVGLHAHSSHAALFCPEQEITFQGYVTGMRGDGKHLVIRMEDGSVIDIHSKQSLRHLAAHDVRITIEDLGNPDT